MSKNLREARERLHFQEALSRLRSESSSSSLFSPPDSSLFSPPDRSLSSPPEKPEGSLFGAGLGKTLEIAETATDVLNTPQQMGLGLLRDLFRQASPLPLDQMGSAMAAGARENLNFAGVARDPAVQAQLPEFLRGELGSTELPILGKVTGLGSLGLMADVVLDPINLVPFGFIPNIFSKFARVLGKTKVFTQARKALMKARGVTEDGILAKALVKESGEARALKERKARRLREQQRERISRLAGGPLAEPANRRGMISLSTQWVGRGLKRLTRAEEPFHVDPGDLGAAIGEVQERFGKRLAPDPFFPAFMPLSVLGPAAKRDKVVLRAKMRLLDAGVKPTKELLDEIETVAIARLELDGPLSEEMLEGIAIEATRLNRDLMSIRFEELSKGLVTLDLQEADLAYLTHLMNPDAKKIIPGATPAMRLLGRVFNAHHSFQLTRGIRGKTVTEINEMGKVGTIPGLKGYKFDGKEGRPDKFLVDDPATLLMVRGLAGEKAMADAELFFQAAKKVGKTAQNEQGTLQRLALAESPDPRTAQIRELYKDTWFEADVKASLDRYYDVVVNPGGPEGLAGWSSFLAGFDRIQAEWKASTLFIFPAYHSRNFVGNIWNNNLAGLDPVTGFGQYKKAKKFQFNSNPDEMIQAGQHQLTKGQWDEVMYDFGISNQFAEYLALSPGDITRGGADLLVAKIPGFKQAFKSGMKAGTLLEDNARIAHFFWRLDKGDDFAKAAISTKKYLFDYNPASLTRFERTALRRAAPFYQWTRYNLPLQIRSIVENPKRVAMLSDIQQSLEEGTHLPSDIEALVGSWIPENMGVPTRTEGGKVEFFLLGGWIPFADLQKFGSLDRTVDGIRDMITPFIKVPLEVIGNRATWTGRKIEQFEGEKGSFVGQRLPKKAIHVLNNVRFFAEMDRAAAAYDTLFGTEYSDRRGENPYAFAIRTLFGLKLTSLDLPLARKRKIKAIQKIRSMIRRPSTDEDNRAILRGILKDPVKLREFMELQKL